MGAWICFFGENRQGLKFCNKWETIAKNTDVPIRFDRTLASRAIHLNVLLETT